MTDSMNIGDKERLLPNRIQTIKIRSFNINQEKTLADNDTKDLELFKKKKEKENDS